MAVTYGRRDRQTVFYHLSMEPKIHAKNEIDVTYTQAQITCRNKILFQMFDNIRALDLFVDHTNRPVAAKMISAEGEVIRSLFFGRSCRHSPLLHWAYWDWGQLVPITSRDSQRLTTMAWKSCLSNAALLNNLNIYYIIPVATILTYIPFA